MKKYKVLFADLDGTLIETISGNTFPKGVWDMRLRLEVLDAIKKLQVERIHIVSNQGGIEKGFVDRDDFQDKLDYVVAAVHEYTGAYCTGSFCSSNDKQNQRRKPNTAMLDDIGWKLLFCTRTEMLMIGDASGKEGQFSDTDKLTAQNYQIDYMDVEDFVAAIFGEEVNFPTIEIAKWYDADKIAPSDLRYDPLGEIEVLCDFSCGDVCPATYKKSTKQYISLVGKRVLNHVTHFMLLPAYPLAKKGEKE
jgi:HAD superfamily hydrolase (TIGR01662 family)